MLRAPQPASLPLPLPLPCSALLSVVLLIRAAAPKRRFLGRPAASDPWSYDPTVARASRHPPGPVPWGSMLPWKRSVVDEPTDIRTGTIAGGTACGRGLRPLARRADEMLMAALPPPLSSQWFPHSSRAVANIIPSLWASPVCGPPVPPSRAVAWRGETSEQTAWCYPGPANATIFNMSL